MNEYLLAALVSMCLALSGGFLSNMFLLMMIGEINRKKNERDLIPYFGFSPPKMIRVFDAYRKTYPHGRLHIYMLAAFAFVVIGLVGVMVLLTLMGHDRRTRSSRSGRADTRVVTLNHRSRQASPGPSVRSGDARCASEDRNEKGTHAQHLIAHPSIVFPRRRSRSIANYPIGLVERSPFRGQDQSSRRSLVRRLTGTFSESVADPRR